MEDTAEDLTKRLALPPERNSFRDGMFGHFDKNTIDENGEPSPATIGKALYDQSDRQAWEVVMEGNIVHFVLKRNLVTAPQSRLTAEVSIDAKSLDVTQSPSSEIVDAVVLHHMVNCNRWSAKQPEDKEFFLCLPLHRAKDLEDLVPKITRSVFEKFDKLLTKKITAIVERHKHLGIFGRGGVLQTFNTRVNNPVSGPMQTAKIARDTVNHTDFRGNIKVDGMIFTMEHLKRSIVASARENQWNVADIDKLLAFTWRFRGRYTETGENLAYNEEDLAEVWN